MTKTRTGLYLLSDCIYGLIFLVLLPSGLLAAEGAPPCAGSIDVTRFKLLVQPVKDGSPLPVQQINVVDAGQKLKYEPLHLSPAIRDSAKIAVVLVAAPKTPPSNPVEKKAQETQEGKKPIESAKQQEKEAKQEIHVLEARPAKDPQEWDVPGRASVVGVVFGPHGLDVKKVNSLVDKNPDLIPQLTEYAEETAKVGALVEALSDSQAQDPNHSVNAALSGFGADYNVAIPKLDTTQPANYQAALLMQAMLPSLQTYDPITSSPAAVTAQSAGLAGAVAGAFFGSPVGLAAGGASLFFNLRTLMFPGSDFRSAFSQPFETSGMALCAKNEPERPRTRVAYLWMTKIPNAPPPVVALPEAANVPIGGKSTLKVPFAKPDEGKLLARAHGWELVSAKSHADIPLKVQAGAPDDQLDLDLTQTKLPPGEYHLAALWDWELLPVKGDVNLRPFGDISKAKVAQASADRLVEGTGLVKVELTGTDFEFVNKVTMAKAGDKRATPKELTFDLPKGGAEGDQESMEVDVDASGWPAGTYHLILAQTNGSTHDVPLVIHPPDPSIDGLPLRANVGETQQTVVIHGARLERITRVSTPNATWELASLKPDAHDVKERKATIKLEAAAHPGDVLATNFYVEDVQAPLTFSDGLQVAGPRPKIAGFTLSLAQTPDVHLEEGEIPAGETTSFSLLIKNADARPALKVTCANDGFLRTPVVLSPGDRTQAAQLDFAGDDGLFLSLDPGVVGLSGCQLSATISTATAGNSDAISLGRIIRVPRIDKFALADEKIGNGIYAGSLMGSDLQTIEKTGWDSKTGYPVQGIPTSVPGSNPPEQTLKVELPWPPPSPHAPIYVWLRGEATGRLTDVKY